MGKMLIGIGILLITIGIVMTVGPKIPWIGRLPGDFSIQRGNFSFYFPLTTCIIISIIATLIFNLLNPRLRYKGWPNVVAIDYDTQGRFAHCREVDAEELATLHRLGAQWDHGGGYVPYTPPPPTHAVVLRRIPVRELPGSQPFRDMGRYLAVDWAAASIAALRGSSEHDLPADLPADIAEAARSLWWDPISLIREPGEPLRFMNGQHRAEAMRQQGAVETIVEELRPVDARPLPGELQTISEC